MGPGLKEKVSQPCVDFTAGISGDWSLCKTEPDRPVPTLRPHGRQLMRTVRESTYDPTLFLFSPSLELPPPAFRRAGQDGAWPVGRDGRRRFPRRCCRRTPSHVAPSLRAAIANALEPLGGWGRDIAGGAPQVARRGAGGGKAAARGRRACRRPDVPGQSPGTATGPGGRGFEPRQPRHRFRKSWKASCSSSRRRRVSAL